MSQNNNCPPCPPCDGQDCLICTLDDADTQLVCQNQPNKFIKPFLILFIILFVITLIWIWKLKKNISNLSNIISELNAPENF